MRPLGLLLIASLAACNPTATRPAMGQCDATLAPSAANAANGSLTGIFNAGQYTPSPPQLVIVCTSNDQTQQLQIVLNGQPVAGASFPLGSGSASGFISYIEDDGDGTHRSWTSTQGTAGVTTVEGNTVSVSFNLVPLSAPPQVSAVDQAVGLLTASGTARLAVQGLP